MRKKSVLGIMIFAGGLVLLAIGTLTWQTRHLEQQIQAVFVDRGGQVMNIHCSPGGTIIIEDALLPLAEGKLECAFGWFQAQLPMGEWLAVLFKRRRPLLRTIQGRDIRLTFFDGKQMREKFTCTELVMTNVHPPAYFTEFEQLVASSTPKEKPIQWYELWEKVRREYAQILPFTNLRLRDSDILQPSGEQLHMGEFSLQWNGTQREILVERERVWGSWSQKKEEAELEAKAVSFLGSGGQSRLRLEEKTDGTWLYVYDTRNLADLATTWFEAEVLYTRDIVEAILLDKDGEIGVFVGRMEEGLRDTGLTVALLAASAEELGTDIYNVLDHINFLHEDFVIPLPYHLWDDILYHWWPFSRMIEAEEAMLDRPGTMVFSFTSDPPMPLTEFANLWPGDEISLTIEPGPKTLLEWLDEWGLLDEEGFYAPAQ